MNQLQRITALKDQTEFSLYAPTQDSQQTELQNLSTVAVHAGEAREKYGSAITDPIFCSSTFTFTDTQAVIDYIEQKQTRAEYGRYGSPGEKVVETKLATLDGAEDAVLFSSGMAAVTALLLTKLQSGDEVIFFDECYHRTRQFCTERLGRLARKHTI